MRLEENYRSVQPVLDVANALLENAPEGYRKRLFSRRECADEPAVRLYRPLSDVYNNPEGVAAITKLFVTLAQSREDFCLMGLTRSGLWRPERKDKGIFQADLVHYLPEVHRYFAGVAMEDANARYQGYL